MAAYLRCPLYPQKRTLGVSRAMSALCQKQTFCAAVKNVVYSITSSARTRSDAGTEKPRAFAVLRLRAVSYLVGDCTGKSAGLAPRRMRSIYDADCWYTSRRSMPYDIRPPSSVTNWRHA